MKKRTNILIIILIILLSTVLAVVVYKSCTFNICRTVSYENQTFISEKIFPPKDFKVAFLADQGVTDDSKKVLEMVRSEGAKTVIHPGDFDYKDSPDEWEKMINDILGEKFPYFITVGNHDLPKWKEYQKKFAQRLERIEGEKCEGELGVNSVCRYKGLRFILSGVGTLGDDDEVYIKENLPNNNFAWQICAWHKNQHLMQTGGKKDEVGWGPYETCRENGAIIATGHEHAYSRTYLLSDFENQIVASTSNTLEISKGKTFAFVSGIAGHSIRPQDDDIPKRNWWANVYTATQEAKPGALFCSFNVAGQKNKADCYFKNIEGNIIDEFSIKNINQ